MTYLSFSSSLPTLMFSLLFLVSGFPVSHSNLEIYTNCHDAVFECGNISIGYPFFGGNRQPPCGHPALKLLCDDDTTTIEIAGVEYQVLNISHEHQTLTIVREDLFEHGFCRLQTPIRDSIIDSKLFYPVPGYTNVTLFYDCPSLVPSNLGIFNCTHSDYSYVSVTTDGVDPGGCSARVSFPIALPSGGSFHFQNEYHLLSEALKKGFQVKWKEDTEACRNCNASGGACGFDWLNQTLCYCQFWNSPEYSNECHGLDPSPKESPPSPTNGGNKYSHGSSSKLQWNQIIALAIGVTVVAAILVYVFVLWFKGNSLSNHFCRGKMKDNAPIEASIVNFGSFAPKRYSYGEIKRMTNKFTHKLGQGGFGSVYKGKLSDGRFVAVKVLSESKGNGEDFMNEVASISRTSHVNVVTLLGFCFEGSKRALIYEFASHGSLDKFIYNKGSDNQSRLRTLEWKTLHDIALGVAKGLEYLHQGCNTRILHFDIKPHNILLDENFCPKISDFGLSKLCKTKESVVSMACARGTIGYIAPEVFCRNFGGVSYKSDVYSYGMLILEMVGGRKNIDAEASRTSEVYFQHGFIGILISLCA
ncbi:putative receptor-like protein kinase [Hibiscus syriacus]|uniref:non-specific serine/threonine protein kinase n=1 Tax=Hibiscus syriacus TaxID=106335 RepID=A0A6A3C0I7_HIBSY|nr:putative receptor-like protein kinase [Hibiscus syriacus]